MSKQVKITREDIDSAIAKLNSIHGVGIEEKMCAVSIYVDMPLSEIKKRIIDLPFSEHGNSASDGVSVKEMVNLTKTMYLMAEGLDNLIISTNEFLNDAKDKWFETDEQIAGKY